MRVVSSLGLHLRQALRDLKILHLVIVRVLSLTEFPV